MLPDDIGKYHRGVRQAGDARRPAAVGGVRLPAGRDRHVSRAEDEEFTVTAWRLQDATGALGAFEWQRPDDAHAVGRWRNWRRKPKTACCWCTTTTCSRLPGTSRTTRSWCALAGSLNSVDSSPLPSLAGYPAGRTIWFPTRSATSGTGRPGKFDPGIPPSTAGFPSERGSAVGAFPQRRRAR